MRNLFLYVFLLLTVSFIPCEEVLYRVTEDAPAWNTNVNKNNNENIAMTIKKNEIVKVKKTNGSGIDSLCKIEYNNKEYEVRGDTLVPAYTEGLFEDSWITRPLSDSQWIPDYYLCVLLSEDRDTFHEFEYKLMDYWDETNILGMIEWYDHVNMDHPCLDISQLEISIGGFRRKWFYITNITNINNGYKITVIDCKYVENDKLLDYENTIAFPTDRLFFDLLLIQDNDFMDMYLDTTENHLATFVRVNKDIIDELTSLLQNNTCDLSKIKSFPKRADGSTVKYSPPVLAADDVIQVEDKMPESAIEKKATVQTNEEASSLPPWAWIAIAGGAVIVIGGGVVAFAVKKRK